MDCFSNFSQLLGEKSSANQLVPSVNFANYQQQQQQQQQQQEEEEEDAISSLINKFASLIGELGVN